MRIPPFVGRRKLLTCMKSCDVILSDVFSTAFGITLINVDFLQENNELRKDRDRVQTLNYTLK
jgi:hypothetical protein